MKRVEFLIEDAPHETGELGPHVGAIDVEDEVSASEAIAKCVAEWSPETLALAELHDVRFSSRSLSGE